MTSVGVMSRRPASIASSTASGAPPRRDAPSPVVGEQRDDPRGRRGHGLGPGQHDHDDERLGRLPMNPSSRSRPMVPLAGLPAGPSRLAEPRDERRGRLELPGAHAAPDRADRHADELLAEAIRGEIPLVAVSGWWRAEQRERRSAGDDADEPDEVHGLAVAEPRRRLLDRSSPPSPRRCSADAAGENSGPEVARRSASWTGPSMLSSASGPIARSISSPWVPGPTVLNRAGSIRIAPPSTGSLTSVPNRPSGTTGRVPAARRPANASGDTASHSRDSNQPARQCARREARRESRRPGAGGQRTSTGSPRLSWWRYQAITPRSP